jgi:hypothetical protein
LLGLILLSGMTQAAIPHLVRQGVAGVSVGVNDMTPPPAVPSLFVWQYRDYSVLATWHPGKTFIE